MATDTVWELVPEQGLVLRDAGTAGHLRVGMMLPGNVDGQHFADTGNLRVMGEDGLGTRGADVGGFRPNLTENFNPVDHSKTEEHPDGSYTIHFADGTSQLIPAPAAAAEAATGDTGDSTDVRATMQSAFYAALRQAGMDKTTIDDLWRWAETEWTNDPSFTAERALIGMYDQQAFKDRFPAIALMPAGTRGVPTPGEYISFEKYVAKELKRVGITEGNFDNLITTLFTNNVGEGEVTERLNVAQKVMWDMPPEVRDKLTDWFGEEYGTSITMKTFLDKTGDWSKIQDDISTARTGGWGQMVAGLDAGWDKDLAKKVSDLGLSQAEQWSRFAELKEQEMLFSENLDETVDLDYATQGVEAAFDLDDNDLSETIDRRATERTAKFSGGGGALLSGTTTGFGAANA